MWKDGFKLQSDLRDTPCHEHLYGKQKKSEQRRTLIVSKIHTVLHVYNICLHGYMRVLYTTVGFMSLNGKKIGKIILITYCTLTVPREYCMIYRGPGFLVIIWFGSSPTPILPFPVSKLFLFLSLPVCPRSNLLPGGGETVGEEPNLTTARKPGPLKHSILSGVY
jgi:hypothetical protein